MTTDRRDAYQRNHAEPALPRLALMPVLVLAVVGIVFLTLPVGDRWGYLMGLATAGALVVLADAYERRAPR